MKERLCPPGERKLKPPVASVNLFQNTLSTVLVWTVVFPLGYFNSLLWRISSDISVLFAKYFLAEFLFYKILSFFVSYITAYSFAGSQRFFCNQGEHYSALYDLWSTNIEYCNSSDPCGSIFWVFRFFLRKRRKVP